MVLGHYRGTLGTLTILSRVAALSFAIDVVAKSVYVKLSPPLFAYVDAIH